MPGAGRIALVADLVEAVEDVRQLLLRDADAVVLDLDAHPAARRPRDRQRTSPPRLREAHGVVEQVVEHPVERVLGGHHDGRLSTSPRSRTPCASAARPRLGEVARRRKSDTSTGRSVERLLAGQQAAALEHVVDEARHAVGLLQDEVERARSLRRVGQVVLLQGLRVQLDGGERRLQLVGDVGDELLLLVRVAARRQRLGELLGQADDEEEEQRAADGEQDPVGARRRRTPTRRPRPRRADAERTT